MSKRRSYEYRRHFADQPVPLPTRDITEAPQGRLREELRATLVESRKGTEALSAPSLSEIKYTDSHTTTIKRTKTILAGFATFQTLADFVAASEIPQDTKDYRYQSTVRNARQTKTEDEAEGWVEFLTHEEFTGVVRRGWADGAGRMQKTLAALEAAAGSITYEPVPVYDVTGSTPDVAAYCNGTPEHMMRFEWVETENAGDIIRVGVNLSASAGIPSDMMFRRGAAVIMLIKALEAAGKQVEVWALDSSKHMLVNRPLHHKLLKMHEDDNARRQARLPLQINTAFNVHRPGRPLDLAGVAAAVALPDTYRRAGFLVGSTINDEAYHSVEPAQHPYADGFDVYAKAMHLFGKNDEFKTDIGAARWAVEHAERLGAHIPQRTREALGL